ncbi:hypothetical protein [Demequina iriomotensis]|uniref:hypothetical protein n=1 Tax=Demequina iriomotensis TaxID=1536641 RepID=UPI0007846F7D|nr:hypothetical protein [Demequina iriomotensis]
MDDREDRSEWAAPGGIVPDSAPTLGSAPAPAPASPPPASRIPTSASWQPGFMPLRPLGFGDLLGLPFRAMRFNRGVVVGGPLLLTLAATALLVVGFWLLFSDASLLFYDATEDLRVDATTIGVLIAAVVAALLADILSSAIVAPGVSRGILGERIRLGDAWGAVRPRIGALLLLYLLAGLAWAGAFGVAVLFAVFAMSGDSVGGVILGVVVVLAVGLAASFLVVLVGGLARPIVVLERRGAVAAIRRARQLLKGRFWWSFLVVFVAAVLIGVVSSVVSQLGSFASLGVTAIAPDNAVAVGIAFAAVLAISTLVSYVLTYSYMGALFALMLVDLRIRHEGFDLTLAEAAEARRA